MQLYCTVHCDNCILFFIAQRWEKSLEDEAYDISSACQLPMGGKVNVYYNTTAQGNNPLEVSDTVVNEWIMTVNLQQVGMKGPGMNIIQSEKIS